MLERPDIADATIARHIRTEYALDVRAVEFLALGADPDAAAFRIACADRVGFAKLRRGTDAAAAGSAVALLGFLAGAGPTRVLAPLPTRTGRLATEVGGHGMVLFPFVEGANGFHAALTGGQWADLGRALAAVHGAEPPPALRGRIRTEAYSPVWRDRLRPYLAAALDHPEPEFSALDPVAREMLATLRTRHADLARILARAEELALAMAASERPFVLCHGDIHAGNVMLAGDGEIFVVDWDNPVMAPRERDLMYIGAGIGAWSDSEDFTAFYQGYGADDADPLGVAYYRCERIVEDTAIYCADILPGGPGLRPATA